MLLYTQKQKKRKSEPRIKLNHNIDTALISTKSETLREIYREFSEARTRYAHFNIKYAHTQYTPRTVI